MEAPMMSERTNELGFIALHEIPDVSAETMRHGMEHRWGRHIQCGAVVRISVGAGMTGCGRMRDIERAQRAGRFDRLALVAGPAVLGSLRTALSPELLSRVALTLTKDVVHRRDWDVRATSLAKFF